MLDLARGNRLVEMRARLEALPRPQAIQELLERWRRGEENLTHLPRSTRSTVFYWVLYHDASLELLTLMWDVMKDDPLKTNIFARVDPYYHQLQLHYFVLGGNTNVEVLQFVIDKFPKALVSKTFMVTLPRSTPKTPRSSAASKTTPPSISPARTRSPSSCASSDSRRRA